VKQSETITARLAGMWLRGATLKQPIVGAGGGWAERRGILLALRDEHGRFGCGEASPLPGYSPDRLDWCASALAQALTEPVHVSLQNFAAEITHVLERIPSRLPAARFALECALLDIIGQALERPVYELLGGAANPPTVPLCALVPGANRPRAGLEALRAGVERGIATFKVKCGVAPFAREFAYLERLAAALPTGGALRVDVNRRWPAPLCAQRLAALAGLPVEFVEEPGDVVPRRLGKARCPAIALDESLANGAATDVAFACADVLVLKPALLGGALVCAKMARLAAAHGLHSVISHLFDGPVALAACAELALSLPPHTGGRAAGLHPHPGLAAWPPAHIPQLGTFCLFPAAHAGLGVSHLLY
jgi:o-succinylbenzoate synthase